jgi:hypothetical protein
VIIRFIDDHRTVFGVEPIYRVLPIAPSTYFRQKQLARDPARRSARAIGDAALKAIIRRVERAPRGVRLAQSLEADGAGEPAGGPLSCASIDERHGPRGASRERAWTTTTQPSSAVDRPADLVERNVTATRPNQLWVSDFTYVATWRGFVHVAFVIDVYARRIVGWRVSSSLATDFVLDALEQAICDRCGEAPSGLVHHSDERVVVRVLAAADGRRNASVGEVIGVAHREILPSPSSACSKRRSFVGSAPGGIWRPLDSRRWTGSIGLIIAGYSNRSATSHRQSTRRATMSRPRSPDSR